MREAEKEPKECDSVRRAQGPPALLELFCFFALAYPVSATFLSTQTHSTF